MRNNDKLKGFRILVVEDDFLAAKALETVLLDLGCEVIGPASSSAEACGLIKQKPVDAAILDINLSPGTCEPVARALRYRSMPFVFITGYGNINILPDDLRGHRVLTKPTDRATITSAVEQLADEARR
jgi:CheY-like chemotaxis protein